jgi:sporulation protein YlmC with PRC-barrel domain
MIRTLLATTAIATLLATGAIAQDAAAPATPADSTTTEAAVAAPTSLLATGYTVTDKDNLATEIIGKQVYSSEAADAEHIGDVNNLVIGENGEIAAVVIGVGGFLGIGEKNVAVKYSELQWVVADDNTERFVLPTSKDALEAAPDFKAEDQTPPPDAVPAADATPADNGAMAPADNNAMAPADNAAATPAGDMIDPSGFTDAQLTADDLEGTTAYGPGNERLGTIGDVVLADDGKTVDAVVIDFGGFLGIGTKPVAVAFENLKFQQDGNNNRYVMLNVTKEQLDAAPAFDADSYKTARDTQRLVPAAM